MSEAKIQCPNCGSQFSLSEGLKKELDSLKEQAKLQTEKTVLAQQEKELAKRKELWLEEHKFELEKKESALNMKLQQERLKLERELLKKSDEEKKILLEKQKEEYEYRIQEERVKNESLAKRVEEASRAAQKTGSQRNQGEALEQIGEQWLKEKFTSDDVTPVKTGLRGADVIHKVISESGKDAGVIKWEFKRTSAWSNKWVTKLEEDMRNVGASLGVIVTETMPANSEIFKTEGNVWIMSTSSYRYLAEMARELVVKISRSDLIANASKDVKSHVFNFVTGPEFSGHFRGILRPLISMQESLDKEIRAMARIHKEREKQIQSSINSVADLYGGLQGVSKKALPTVDELELSIGNE